MATLTFSLASLLLPTRRSLEYRTWKESLYTPRSFLCARGQQLKGSFHLLLLHDLGTSNRQRWLISCMLRPSRRSLRPLMNSASVMSPFPSASREWKAACSARQQQEGRGGRGNLNGVEAKKQDLSDFLLRDTRRSVQKICPIPRHLQLLHIHFQVHLHRSLRPSRRALPERLPCARVIHSVPAILVELL